MNRLLLPCSYLNRRSQRGFTLIELLIVISILVILASVVAMEFSGHDYDARYTTTKSNLATLRTAIALYRSRHSKFPEPTVSGGADSTMAGEFTLQAILSNEGNYGDGTAYIRGYLPAETLSDSRGARYVCLVKTLDEFYEDNSSFDNCTNPSSIESISTNSGSGYVYCPINGAIRLNFIVEGVDLRKESQSHIGILLEPWTHWAAAKPELSKDWPVRW